MGDPERPALTDPVSTWTLHADFKVIDGGETRTMSVHIATNVPVIGDAGVVYEPGFVPVDPAGILEVPLPAEDLAPHEFGFIVTRTRFDGGVDTWEVPTQAADATRELNEFTNTTGLPVPDLSQLLAGRDPRWPEGTVLPLRADWDPQWILFALRNPDTGSVDLYDKKGLPA